MFSYGGNTRRRVVRGDVTVLFSCIDSHVRKPAPATFDLLLSRLTVGGIMSADTAVTCTF